MLKRTNNRSKIFSSNMERSHKIHIFPNGHGSHPGWKISYTSNRFITLNELLNSLGKKFHKLFPFGVNKIMTPRRGTEIRTLHQLTFGNIFVCGGPEKFKKIKYGSKEHENHLKSPWMKTPIENAEDKRLINVAYFTSQQRMSAQVSIGQKSMPDIETFLTKLSTALGLTGEDKPTIVYNSRGKKMENVQGLFKGDGVYLITKDENVTLDDVKAVLSENFTKAEANERLTYWRILLNDRTTEATASHASSNPASRSLRLSELQTRKNERLKQINKPQSVLEEFESEFPQCKSVLPSTPVPERTWSLYKNATTDIHAFKLPLLKSKQNRLLPHLAKQLNSEPELFTNFLVGSIISRGMYSIVRIVQPKKSTTARKFALKVVDKLMPPEKCVNNVAREVDILSDCDQAQIVQLFAVYETPKKVGLLISLAEHGDLFDEIQSRIRLTENEGRFIVRDLAMALVYLHDRRIVHRDVKPENILIRSRTSAGMPKVMLTDFGLARYVEVDLTEKCGTPMYVAPEILVGSGYGLEVDLWALGVVTYLMIAGIFPFNAHVRNRSKLFEAILTSDFGFPKSQWTTISCDCRNAVKRMLTLERNCRISASRLLKHPWLNASIAASSDHSFDSFFFLTQSGKKGHNYVYNGSSKIPLRSDAQNVPTILTRNPNTLEALMLQKEEEVQPGVAESVRISRNIEAVRQQKEEEHEVQPRVPLIQEKVEEEIQHGFRQSRIEESLREVNHFGTRRMLTLPSLDKFKRIDYLSKNLMLNGITQTDFKIASDVTNCQLKNIEVTSPTKNPSLLIESELTDILLERHESTKHINNNLEEIFSPRDVTLELNENLKNNYNIEENPDYTKAEDFDLDKNVLKESLEEGFL